MAASGEEVPDGPYSVGDAIKDYLDAAKRRGMKGHRITEQTANAHIIPALGTLPVAKLTRRRIEDWHLALSEAPRRSTGKVKEEAEHLAAPVTDEEKRKRKNTANRILTVLKAALNHALACNKVMEPAPWRAVKPFKGVNSSRMRFLSVGDQRKLVEACEPGFRALVQAALFTGARYGELGRLTEAMDREKIPLIALKGMALAETVYANTGLREMLDIDLLIAAARAVTLPFEVPPELSQSGD